MASGADAEMMVRLRQPEIGEEGVLHVGVVMLAGMDQNRREGRIGGERVPERRDLHEIRSCRGDQVNPAGHYGSTMHASCCFHPKITPRPLSQAHLGYMGAAHWGVAKW